MMEALKVKVEQNSKSIEELRHTVYGNGSKGLKLEFAELKTEIATFKKLITWQIGVSLTILALVIKILF